MLVILSLRRDNDSIVDVVESQNISNHVLETGLDKVGPRAVVSDILLLIVVIKINTGQMALKIRVGELNRNQTGVDLDLIE